MKIIQTCLNLIFLITLSLSFATVSYAAEASAKANLVNPPPAPQLVPHVGTDKIHSASELNLTLSVLAFGLIIILLQFFLMWRLNFDSQSVMKMSTVTLVITGTLFFIAAGFSSEQIAPALGLFGSIVGYLLGRNSGPESK